MFSTDFCRRAVFIDYCEFNYCHFFLTQIVSDSIVSAVVKCVESFIYAFILLFFFLFVPFLLFYRLKL